MQHKEKNVVLILWFFTFRFSKLRTFFSTVWRAKDNAESLGLPMTSLEVMLEAEVTLEEVVETRDADGIVAIEMMMMSQHNYIHKSMKIAKKFCKNAIMVCFVNVKIFSKKPKITLYSGSTFFEARGGSSCRTKLPKSNSKISQILWKMPHLLWISLYFL